MARFMLVLVISLCLFRKKTSEPQNHIQRKNKKRTIKSEKKKKTIENSSEKTNIRKWPDPQKSLKNGWVSKLWPTHLADVGQGPGRVLHFTLEALNTWGEGAAPRPQLVMNFRSLEHSPAVEPPIHTWVCAKS